MTNTTSCRDCLGFGRVPGAENMLVPCAACGGTGNVPGAVMTTTEASLPFYPRTEYGRCEVCTRPVTEVEDERLSADIDFVEHHGHLIRRVRDLKRVRPSLTVTATRTEEEPNGWAYAQEDRSVGIYGGWSHDHPSHEDEWPEVEEVEAGRCGEPLPNGAVPVWERHECKGCGAVLVLLYSGQLDMDGDLLW